MQAKRHVRTFGVLEIIISVAILAVFSVFIIRLFYTASSAENKVRQLDAATYAAISYAENFQSSDSPSAFAKSVGTAAESGGAYTVNARVSDTLHAQLSLKKSESNDSGSLYKLQIKISGSDGKSVYTLSDEKFFAGLTE